MLQDVFEIVLSIPTLIIETVFNWVDWFGTVFF